jgi:carbonic anhydrase
MFNRIIPVPAAGTSSTLPTTSRRAFGRRLGLSAAGLALAGCSASEPAADSAPAEAAVDQGFVPARDAASQAAVTPDAALTLLADGNARFVAGTPVRRDYSVQIRVTAGGQYPFAVVLGCIDSRVPIETVFDQGIGDVFAARVAGNIVNTELLGSMEFACQLAGAKLVVVLGHTSCGAVKGAISSARLGNLTQLVQKIEPAVEAIEGERDVDNADYVDGVAEENVRMVIAEIRRESSVLATMEQEREIRIVGGMYDVSTGIVRFI